MKKVLIVLCAIMVAIPVFSQTRIGWREESVTSYCNEYDLMIGDKGYWTISWDDTKRSIKSTLVKDGFRVEETDSTIEWIQSEIYKCNIQFKPNGKIAHTSIIITVGLKHGPDISASLKRKHDLMHGTSGKFVSGESYSGYSWLDERCINPIYTLLAKNVMDNDKYLITIFSSKIGN